MTAPRSLPALPPVVVGFDGSDSSAHAVDVAVDEARGRGTRLVVLVVAGSSRLWSDGVEELYGDAAATLSWATATGVAGVRRAALRCPDLTVDVVVGRGVGSPEILELGGQAHLLVLGDRGRHGQGCLRAGATSAELALAFRCPVLITRRADRTASDPPGVATPDRSPGTVVAGVDGRESSAAVLMAAIRECRLRDRALVAVHAVGSSRTAPQHLADKCWRLFDDAVTSLGSGRADLLFAPGAPASALTGRAQPADLLVVGTHSRGRLRASDSRAVIRQVLDLATCDVLVVPLGSGLAPAAAHVPAYDDVRG